MHRCNCSATRSSLPNDKADQVHEQSERGHANECSQKHQDVCKPEQTLLWISQDIEPAGLRAVPLVRAVLRRVLHAETVQFLQVRTDFELEIGAPH